VGNQTEGKVDSIEGWERTLYFIPISKVAIDFSLAQNDDNSQGKASA
jgi:hypothetical protein